MSRRPTRSRPSSEWGRARRFPFGSRKRAISICCWRAIRSLTGGSRETRTRRCSTNISARISNRQLRDRRRHHPGVLWGLKNGEGQGFQPKAVMLMIGTNNTGGTGQPAPPPPQGRKAWARLSWSSRNDFPRAKILLLAIFPADCRRFGAQQDRWRSAGSSRVDDQRHVFYMDIGAKFLDEQRAFLTDSFRPDNLHPQAKGYDIWGAAVKMAASLLEIAGVCTPIQRGSLDEIRDAAGNHTSYNRRQLVQRQSNRSHRGRQRLACSSVNPLTTLVSLAR